MANNLILQNAAFNGFIAGSLGGRYITDTVSADYNSSRVAALAFAVAVDTAIPVDAAIITPIDKYTLSHSDLVEALCRGNGAFITDPTGADYNATAAAIAVAYANLKAALV